MAGRSRLGCWLGGLGCGLALLLVLGGVGMVFTSARVMEGEPEVGGVDLRRFDVLKLSDALSAELEPVTMRLLDDGRLELRADLVRGGDGDWQWTGFSPRLQEVRIEGQDAVPPQGEGWSVSSEPAGMNGPSRRVPIDVVIPVPGEPADGAEVELALGIKISTDRLGGLARMTSDQSYSVVMGRWGEWFDNRVTPVSGQLTDPDAAQEDG